MSALLANRQLEALSGFVRDRLGLHFPPSRWRDLARDVDAAAAEHGYKNPEDFVHWLLSSPVSSGELAWLSSHLTIGETYFFRDTKLFQVLERQILPELIQRKAKEKRLRIWSAGCCTGEEAYSIAIAAHRQFVNLPDWQITILATDINPIFLERAVKGVYGEWSFRETDAPTKARYFEKDGLGQYALHKDIRDMVSFANLNLAGDTYPSLGNNTYAMDIIFCRNVLMYFAPDTMALVVERLGRALVQEGWLAVSPSETSQTLFSGFKSHHINGAILYRKEAPREMNSPRVSASAILPAVRPKPVLKVSSARARVAAGRASAPAITPRKLKQAEPAAIDRATQLYRDGHYAEARTVADALLSEDQNNAPALALLAQISANEGRLDEAKRWCEKASAADRNNHTAYYLLAMILQEQDLFEEAGNALRRALYIRPGFILGHVKLGDLLKSRGRMKDAMKHWRNAAALLDTCDPVEVVPESDGMTSQRMRDYLTMAMAQGARA